MRRNTPENGYKKTGASGSRATSNMQERPPNEYQSGYRQRQYEDRRPPIGARRQISYDRLNTGARTQEWPDRSRAFNNTSYLQFPQQSRITTGDDRTCNRCGMQGHIRRQCQLQVAYCTFCNATSHTTGACRARAAFVRDNPVSSSRRTSPNKTNVGGTSNNAQQPRGQQTMNHTSQCSVEPAANATQNMVNQVQQLEEHAQQTVGNGVQASINTAGRPEEGETMQASQIPMNNAEISSYQPQISSYQPQYQENRTRISNMQERHSAQTRSAQQGGIEGTTRVNQQDISPQLEALQAQISVMQLQLAQHTQQVGPYQQPAAVDPLMVVGPWQHTEHQPTTGAQLMGQPHGNQGAAHHIQPTSTNMTTGRGSLVLNTSIPPPTIQTHPVDDLNSQESLLRSV